MLNSSKFYSCMKDITSQFFESTIILVIKCHLSYVETFLIQHLSFFLSYIFFFLSLINKLNLQLEEYYRKETLLRKPKGESKIFFLIPLDSLVIRCSLKAVFCKVTVKTASWGSLSVISFFKHHISSVFLYLFIFICIYLFLQVFQELICPYSFQRQFKVLLGHRLAPAMEILQSKRQPSLQQGSLSGG